MKASFMIVSIFWTSVVSAQWYIGVNGGIARNVFRTDISNLVNTHYIPQSSPTISMTGYYKFNDWLGVQNEMNFVQKNNKWQRDGFYEGVYLKNRNNYLQLPIMARFLFGGKNLKGFLNAGVYGGYWLSGTTSGLYPDISASINSDNNTPTAKLLDIVGSISFKESYRFDEDRDNRWEAGLAGGLGVQWSRNEKHIFFVQSRYFYSMTGQARLEGYSSPGKYNETLTIETGLLINLKALRNDLN